MKLKILQIVESSLKIQYDHVTQTQVRGPGGGGCLGVEMHISQPKKYWKVAKIHRLNRSVWLKIS